MTFKPASAVTRPTRVTAIAALAAAFAEFVAEGGRVQRFREGYSELPPLDNFGRLYQRDPDKRLVGEPFIGTAIGIPAAIGSTPVPMNPVSGWPLFCDNIVLRIDSQGTLRIEYIDDIELHLEMEVGSPPPIAGGIW